MVQRQLAVTLEQLNAENDYISGLRIRKGVAMPNIGKRIQKASCPGQQTAGAQVLAALLDQRWPRRRGLEAGSGHLCLDVKR